MWANILSGSLLTKVLLENKGSAFLFWQWNVLLQSQTGWLVSLCPRYAQPQHERFHFIERDNTPRFWAEVSQGCFKYTALSWPRYSKDKSSLFTTSSVNCLRRPLLQNCGSEREIQRKLWPPTPQKLTSLPLLQEHLKPHWASPRYQLLELLYWNRVLPEQNRGPVFLPCSGEVSAPNIKR